MSRQLEQHWEEARKKRDLGIVAAVEFGLVAAVERSGAEFYGFAARVNPSECLLTIKVSLAGRRQVAFVGSDTLGSALLKAVRLGNTDKLIYKDDMYAG